MSRSPGLLSRVLRRLLPDHDVLEVDGSRIPPPESRLCGQEFKDNAFYLESAEREARRLVEHFGCGCESRILDVGCGLGRLATGLIRVVGEMPYLGVDVEKKSIHWCQRNFQKFHPGYRFEHLNLRNDRYNKNGVCLDKYFRFSPAAGGVDVVYLFSVFSHMTLEDLKLYLTEFSRVLAEGGGLFFTTFVEDGVPPVTLNPAGYRFTCSGPLHVVRYEREYLFDLLKSHGFALQAFSHATETDGQSALSLRKI
jgi:SAM-dependent methyltransferase